MYANDPNATLKNMMESNINPTELLPKTAANQFFLLIGEYINQSAVSDNKNAVPEARANLWASARIPDNKAPIIIADIIQNLFPFTCKRSLNVNANPAK